MDNLAIEDDVSNDEITLLNESILRNNEVKNELCSLEKFYTSRLEYIRSQLAKIRLGEVVEVDLEDLDENSPAEEKEDQVLESTLLHGCGMPYFRDPSDVSKTLKEEPNPFSMPKVFRHWTGTEKNKFLALIRSWEIERYYRECKPLRDLLSIRIKTATDPDEKEILNDEFAKLLHFNIWRMDLKDLLTSSKEQYNWDLVSAKLGKVHTPFECQNMWSIFLHPKFNKGPWKTRENESLMKIAAKHNNQNWEAISSELGTERSPFMCFIHFQTRLNDESRNTWWTQDEDAKLKILVRNHSNRSGSVVYWSKVAPFMTGRTRSQLISRWKYTLDPNIKRGHFTPQETNDLLDGIRKYGNDWQRIHIHFLPQRTTVQIRDRVRRLAQRVKRGSWEREEDELLLKLVEQYGPGNWRQVQNHFIDRNKSQLRFRHKSLTKARSKRIYVLGTKRNIRNRDDARLHTKLNYAFVDNMLVKCGLPSSPRITKTAKVGRPRVEKKLSPLDQRFLKYFSYEKKLPGRPKTYKDEQIQEITNTVRNLSVIAGAKITVPLIHIVRNHIKGLRLDTGILDRAEYSTYSALTPLSDATPSTSFDSQCQIEIDNTLQLDGATDPLALSLLISPLTVIRTGVSDSQYKNDVEAHHKYILSKISMQQSRNIPVIPSEMPSNQPSTNTNSLTSGFDQSVLCAGIYSDFHEIVDKNTALIKKKTDKVISGSAETTSQSNSCDRLVVSESGDFVLNRENFPKCYRAKKTLYLFPPNISTITGFRASMLSAKRLKRWGKNSSCVTPTTSEKAVEAKRRWSDRCRQLFLIPQLMTEILPQVQKDSESDGEDEEVDLPVVKPIRGRPRKPKKEVTRPKRKYVSSGKFKKQPDERSEVRPHLRSSHRLSNSAGNARRVQVSPVKSDVDGTVNNADSPTHSGVSLSSDTCFSIDDDYIIEENEREPNAKPTQGPSPTSNVVSNVVSNAGVEEYVPMEDHKCEFNVCERVYEIDTAATGVTSAGDQPGTSDVQVPVKSEAVIVPVAAKRRGRPPKGERPRKTEEAVVLVTAKRKRGRPPKQKRPRKNVLIEG